MAILRNWKYYLLATILSFLVGIACYFISSKVFAIIYWVVTIVSLTQMILTLNTTRKIKYNIAPEICLTCQRQCPNDCPLDVSENK